MLAVAVVAYLIAFNRPLPASQEVTTESGLKYVDERVGDGPTPKPGQTVTVNYVGTTQSTGVEFDNSYKRHQPADFKIGVGQVIKGWDEGLMTMRLRDRAAL